MVGGRAALHNVIYRAGNLASCSGTTLPTARRRVIAIMLDDDATEPLGQYKVVTALGTHRAARHASTQFSPSSETGQRAVAPPSQGMIAAVRKAEAGDARKVARPATSAGAP